MGEVGISDQAEQGPVIIEVQDRKGKSFFESSPLIVRHSYPDQVILPFLKIKTSQGSDLIADNLKGSIVQVSSPVVKVN